MRMSDGLCIPRGITAVVGGGGKTSLIWRLATELSEDARVLITTTTHIRPPECRVLLAPTREQIREAFIQTRLLAIGDPTEDGKLAMPSALYRDFSSLADYILVEADGSRGLPLKAPADHEPVLPEETRLTIAVAGMSCAGQTIQEAAHRPALYAERAGVAETAMVTPGMVAERLMSPEGQHKGVTGPFLVVLNQSDTPERITFARQVAGLLPIDSVLTALQTRPDWAEYWHTGKHIPLEGGFKS